MKRGLLLALTLLLSISLLSACSSSSGGAKPADGSKPADTSKPAPKTVKIGLHTALSGSAAQMGKDQQTGVKLAVDELNAKGGAYQYDLVSLDDEGKPDKAAAAMRNLLNQGVIAVIGAPLSSNNLAAAPIAEDNKIPYIANGTLVTTTHSGWKFTVRAAVADDILAQESGKFIVQQKKLTKIALIHESDAYGKGYADEAAKGAEAVGGQIVVREQYTRGDRDFTSQILKVKDAKPDAIIIGGLATESAAILKQIRQLIPGKIHIQGTDIWGQAETIRLAGADNAASVVYNDSATVRDNPDPNVQKWLDGFKARNGADPVVQATKGYVSMMLIADALGRAGSTDGQKLRDALYATKGLATPMGVVNMKDNGDGFNGLVMMELQPDGGKKLIWKNF